MDNAGVLPHTADGLEGVSDVAVDLLPVGRKDIGKLGFLVNSALPHLIVQPRQESGLGGGGREGWVG